MDRTACVDVPALPLQLLLRGLAAGGGDRDRPVAVVDRDHPQGTILWVNEASRRHCILPGMRYAAALSLSSDLRAGVVAAATIAAAVDELTGHLWSFTPVVEPAPDEPGVFWLDVSGILPLYRSFEDWAQRVRRALAQAAFVARIAVGFTRFGGYAAARACGTRRGVVVFGSRAAEAAHLRTVPLDRLGFEPKLRDRLCELGVDSLGAFLDLPAAGIRRRFGKAAHALHALARSDAAADLTPVPLHPPLDRSLILDRPEADRARVLAAIQALLAPLLATLAQRQHAVRQVGVTMRLDDNQTIEETLEPAEPTGDAVQLLNLVDLRLATLVLSAGVNEIHVRATGVAQRAHQRDLFAAPPRDLAAARRALARIRAEFGEGAVVQAYLQEGHLPEACFGLGAFGRLDVPQPQPQPQSEPQSQTEPPQQQQPQPPPPGTRPLVRRFFHPPIPLPMRSKSEPDGWILDFADGPVDEVVGPRVIHGGWWLREVRREYYYARTRNGRWLWLYHDRRRRRWFLQGEVE